LENVHDYQELFPFYPSNRKTEYCSSTTRKYIQNVYYWTVFYWISIDGRTQHTCIQTTLKKW